MNAIENPQAMLQHVTLQSAPWARRGGRLLLVIFAILIFACCKANKNHFSQGDALGTLLVSQALLEQGTIRLDAYRDKIPPRYQFQLKNDHTYYYFPIGTSVIVTPLVAIAMANGKDTMDSNRRLQGKMAGLVNIGVLLLLFAIARRHVAEPAAALFAGAFWFSTSLASVLGTALWSHDLAVFFALASLWLIDSKTPLKYRAAFATGCLLFLAYFCRPTMALLAILSCIYIAFSSGWRSAALTAFSCGLGLATFVVFSWSEFGQLLPDYYMPQRLNSGTFGTALYGNLLSPARGFLIYTPILLLFIVSPSATARAMKKNPGLWLFLTAWIALHWAFISRFPHWWAGHSYGPRLMVDVLPAVAVLLALTLQQLIAGWRQDNRNVVAVAVVTIAVLGGCGMHTWQGLFNIYSSYWNVDPNVDANPQTLFDWRYPQFLHTRERHEKRRQVFEATQPATQPPS